jgi:sterol 14-demethylase
MEDLDLSGFRIAAGKLVGASPAISNRIPEDFPDPDAFVPERYLEPREEDRANPWTWIPFGAGRHRCVGANFAMMQLKAIFSVLLQGWEFEAAQPLGHLPQRPLEDGGPAPAALPGALPPAPAGSEGATA